MTKFLPAEFEGTLYNSVFILKSLKSRLKVFYRILQKLVRIVTGLHKRILPEIKNSLSEWDAEEISAHEIKQIYRPKGWNNDTFKYDLAIIVLKTPITFNEKVQPIKIDWIDPDTTAFEGFLQSISISFSQRKYNINMMFIYFKIKNVAK